MVEEEIDCLFCRKARNAVNPPPFMLSRQALNLRAGNNAQTEARPIATCEEPPSPVIPYEKVKPTGVEIGRGAYGRVYEVECENTCYAAKEIHEILLQSTQGEDLEAVETNFLNECRIWSSLHHPCIVEFVGIYYPTRNMQRLPVIIMQKMDISLTNHVKNHSDLEFNKIATILNDACLGLKYLHSRNPPIVHRDLTPNNILLCSHLRAKITDLGVARTLQVTGTNYKTMTKVPGTPDFMPPESLSDNPVYDLAVDIFAFGGVILYTTTRQWPTPSSWIRFDPNTGEKSNLTELQRRQQYMDGIPSTFVGFKPLVKSCLDDNPKNRPAVTKVLMEIESIKNTFNEDSLIYVYQRSITHLQKQQVQLEQDQQQNIQQHNPQEEQEPEWHGDVLQQIKQQEDKPLKPDSKMSIFTPYVAIYDYSAEGDEYLSFKKGDMFYILSIGEGDWWYAATERTGQEGYIPCTYITKYRSPKPDASINTLYAAKYDYSSENEGYLSFKKGDMFYILSMGEGDWWFASTEDTGEEGYIPRNCFTEHRSPKPDASICTLYIAECDYSSEIDGYLSFKKGDLFYISNTDKADWWYASTEPISQEGYIPSNCVKKHNPPKPEPEISDHLLYVAKCDYSSEGNEYLSFKKGDLIYVLSTAKGYWWLARAKHSGQEGYIPNNYVVQINTLDAEEWFYGAITREHAESLLEQSFNDCGSYLIRNSESTPGDYSLSVKCEHGVVHYKIKHSSRGYSISDWEHFESIPKLVAYYNETSGDLCINLKNTCLSTKPETDSSQPEEAAEIWEVERQSIQFVEKLGAGKFGETWLGIWNHTTEVAVKVLEQGIAGSNKFLEELALLKQLRHPKLINIYAVCTKQEPVYILTELMKYGSLLKYLRGDGRLLKLPQLIAIGAQVADGMAYLENKSFVHQDLAARNILVSENLICKVEVVSMARVLSKKFSGVKFPIKWIAPEAMFNHHFTTKSDVWSFGIFLSELITYGSFPYPEMNDAEVLKRLTEGYRMPCPKGCPEQLYNIMKECWRDEAATRPTFESLHWRMEDFVVANEPIHLYPHQVS